MRYLASISSQLICKCFHFFNSAFWNAILIRSNFSSFFPFWRYVFWCYVYCLFDLSLECSSSLFLMWTRMVCICAWVFLCACLCVGLWLACEESFSITLHLILWGRVSQMNLELPDVASSLASQHAVRITGCLPRPVIIGRPPYPSMIFMESWDLNSSPHVCTAK